MNKTNTTPVSYPTAVFHRSAKGATDSNIVPYKCDQAKTKLAGAKVVDEAALAVLSLEATRPLIMSALVDLVCSGDTAKTIARRYSLKPSTLHYWAARVGLPMRQRGRRALLEPAPKHARILELVREHGVTEAARRIRISKQRVHQIVCRWEPELRGRRSAAKIVALPRPRRRAPRNIVVSFRITTNEWQRLLAAGSVAGEGKMSGFAKARAIVLSHIAPPRGDGSGPAQVSGSRADCERSFVDFYNHKAA